MRNGNHRGDYVKAWRHVHDLFEQAGADNVVWLWSPNVVRDAPAVSLRGLYPGDAYVDLVGMTGYQDDESTAGAVFDATLARLRGLTGRPVVIAETGARPGRKKAAWIAAFFR
ncbi:glycosyl hydrolase [Streptomyces sp. NPDC051105]|uniref:glycosyl hydrolase n=1 Tax=Streptomyces sp. NPDC051105 TaxID=3154843 RepID=UPI003434B4D0